MRLFTLLIGCAALAAGSSALAQDYRYGYSYYNSPYYYGPGYRGPNYGYSYNQGYYYGPRYRYAYGHYYESPGANHSDWCSTNPPSGYCMVPEKR